MLFTDHMIQFWWRLALPQIEPDYPTPQKEFQASWFWYVFTPPFPTYIPDFVTTWFDITLHLTTCLQTVGVTSPRSYTWTMFYYYGGVWNPINGLNHFGVSELVGWPSKLSCQITRISSTPGRRGRGRLFLANFPKTWSLNGETLVPTGLAEANLLAELLNQPIASQGGTLTPQLCSLADGTLSPITATYANQRVAICRKRGLSPRYKPGPSVLTPRV